MNGLEPEDARNLPAAAQEEKCKQAIRLRAKGLTYEEIASELEVYWSTVGRWCRAYAGGGVAAIKAKMRAAGAG